MYYAETGIRFPCFCAAIIKEDYGKETDTEKTDNKTGKYENSKNKDYKKYKYGKNEYQDSGR